MRIKNLVYRIWRNKYIKLKYRDVDNLDMLTKPIKLNTLLYLHFKTVKY